MKTTSDALEPKARTQNVLKLGREVRAIFQDVQSQSTADCKKFILILWPLAENYKYILCVIGWCVYGGTPDNGFLKNIPVPRMKHPRRIPGKDGEKTDAPKASSLGASCYDLILELQSTLMPVSSMDSEERTEFINVLASDSKLFDLIREELDALERRAGIK